MEGLSGVFLPARDGWPLWVERIPAVGLRRGVVLCVHAMMVDRRTFTKGASGGLAGFLAAQGWEVMLADLRGHGRSLPHARMGAAWTYDDLVRQDLPALFAEAERRAGGLPWAYLGHSLGGHSGLAALVETGARPQQLVMVAAAVWLRRAALGWRDLARAGLTLAAFEASARPLGRFPAQRLRIGSVDESAPYVADLCRFWWSDRWGSRDGVDWRASLSGLGLPTTVIASEADVQLAPVKTCVSFAAPLRPAVHVLRGAGAPDHMGLVMAPGGGGSFALIAEALGR